MSTAEQSRIKSIVWLSLSLKSIACSSNTVEVRSSETLVLTDLAGIVSSFGLDKFGTNSGSWFCPEQDYQGYSPNRCTGSSSASFGRIGRNSLHPTLPPLPPDRSARGKGGRPPRRPPRGRRSPCKREPRRRRWVGRVGPETPNAGAFDGHPFGGGPAGQCTSVLVWER